MAKVEEKLTYEEASQRLENVVQHLEQGELNLEESLKCFEEAVGLVNYCKKMLTEAEQRLAVLLENEDGSFELKPLSFAGEIKE